jgi:hypothetical protein
MSTENRVFIAGKIKAIFPQVEVGTAGFKKRAVVVTTDEQYPQSILIQFVQDKCIILDKYNIGDSVEIDFNLKGREWTNPKGETVFFNTLQGWKINKVNSDQSTPPVTENKEPAEDLPF